MLGTLRATLANSSRRGIFVINLASREPVYHMLLTDGLITVLVLLPSEKQEDIQRETNE